MNARFLIVLLLAPLSAFARMGNEGGHGGDPYALEFKTIADSLSQKLAAEQQRDPSLFQKWNFTADTFRKASAAVRVTSDEAEAVILDGQQVDAINYPAQNMILVNRARWREDDLAARARLVLHEIFGILNVERDAFPASVDFADFTTRAAQQMAVERPKGSYMMSLYYGRCLAFPTLNDTETCESGSDKLAKAESCAVTQAEGKCKMSGQKGCSLVNTSYTPVLSTTQLGLRYCEVLVIMK